MKDWRGFIGFVAFTMLASVAYGVLHDLITSQVCPAYFLPPYHTEVIASRSPVALALTWGVIATWWAGLLLGALMGAANMIGDWDPIPWQTLRRRVAISLVSIWLLAMVILVGGYVAMAGNRDAALLAVGATHDWSYLASAICSVVIAMRAWRARGPT